MLKIRKWWKKRKKVQDVPLVDLICNECSVKYICLVYAGEGKPLNPPNEDGSWICEWYDFNFVKKEGIT